VLPTTESGERLWRARRRHHHVDAVVRAQTSGYELLFFHDDRLIVTWPFGDRDTAVAEAGSRLRDLQRAGWNVHW
jgi:hypothetical protein